ncbi:UPAR/Ly6 domain-containing protein CG9338-like [Prorops nasuta]|uniref:UPAR/Ly6 domain-containing protein CG9338-like n=1 Tax=Prorops nasuta TaxID=863751 RepID=UPI0034CF08AE
MQQRNTAVLLIVFSLVLAVRSEEPLKCYQCNSVMNDGCRMDPKAHKLEPIECTFNNMKSWQKDAQENHLLRPIASIFEIDNVQHYGNTVPKEMTSCSKMVFKINGQDVTVRGCQPPKTENIDTCKTTRNKLMNNQIASVEYCGLCDHESCNGSSIPAAPRGLIMFFAVLLPLLMAVASRVA